MSRLHIILTFVWSSNETEWTKEKQAETSWQKIDLSVSYNEITFDKKLLKDIVGWFV